MVNNSCGFVALFLISLFSPSNAENYIDKTQWKGVVETQKIVINNLFGDVRIRYGGENKEIEYIAVIQQLDKDDEIYVLHKSKEDTFAIESHLKSGKSSINKSRVDLTVFMPSGKSVSVLTDSGLIEAKGITANLDFSTKSGTINISKINGHINTLNTSGQTHIIFNKKTSKKQQLIESITGNISILIGENANASITASTSGDIISDFSMKVIQNRNQEPDKTAQIKINKSKSNITLNSKRGTIAVREFRIYN